MENSWDLETKKFISEKNPENFGAQNFPFFAVLIYPPDFTFQHVQISNDNQSFGTNVDSTYGTIVCHHILDIVNHALPLVEVGEATYQR